MTRHLHWLVLNDGVTERVTEDHIDPGEEAAVIDRTLLAVCSSGRGVAKRHSCYIVEGEITSKHALLRLFDEGVPLADIAVCLHSRSARPLWLRILSMQPADDLPITDMPRSPPWCVVRYYAPEIALPSWFDHWTKVVGMALVRREGW